MDVVFTIVVALSIYLVFATGGTASPGGYLAVLVLVYLIKSLSLAIPLLALLGPLQRWSTTGADLAGAARASALLDGAFGWWWGSSWVLKGALLIAYLAARGAPLSAVAVALFLTALACGALLQCLNLARTSHAQLREHIVAATSAAGGGPLAQGGSIRWRLTALGLILVIAPSLWMSSLFVARGGAGTAPEIGAFVLVLAMWGAVNAAAIGARVTRPIEQLERLVSGIRASGDLTRQVEVYADDETGRLAESLRAFLASWRQAMQGSRALVAEFGALATQVSEATGRVRRDAEQSRAMVDEVRRALVAVHAAFESIQSTGQQIAAASDQSTGAVREVERGAASIRQAMQQLAQRSEGSAAAADELRTTAFETAATVRQLDQRTGLTASAMAELDALTRQIGERAASAAAMSQEVGRQAVDSSERLQGSARAIRAVSERSRHAAVTNTRLAEAFARVRGIVKVIDDLADQTNLLALNAAIIAAQAGAQGAGFSVVAEQIKQLARTTATSTGEIESIIQTIDQEAAQATAALQASVGEAEHGLQAMALAEQRLGAIVVAMRDSLGQVEGIATHGQEQSTRAGQVNLAAQDITRSLGELRRAAEQQASSTALIAGDSEEIQALSRQVLSATDHQVAGLTQVVQAQERARALAAELRVAQQRETERIDSLSHAAGLISQGAAEQQLVVRELEDRVAVLVAQAEGLRAQVARFIV